MIGAISINVIAGMLAAGVTKRKFAPKPKVVHSFSMGHIDDYVVIFILCDDHLPHHFFV